MNQEYIEEQCPEFLLRNQRISLGIVRSRSGAEQHIRITASEPRDEMD
jgi:hypothetical protein